MQCKQFKFNFFDFKWAVVGRDFKKQFDKLKKYTLWIKNYLL